MKFRTRTYSKPNIRLRPSKLNNDLKPAMKSSISGESDITPKQLLKEVKIVEPEKGTPLKSDISNDHAQQRSKSPTPAGKAAEKSRNVSPIQKMAEPGKVSKVVKKADSSTQGESALKNK